MLKGCCSDRRARGNKSCRCRGLLAARANPGSRLPRCSDASGAAAAGVGVKCAALGDGMLLCVPLRQPPGLGKDARSCNGSGGSVCPDAEEIQEVLRTRGVLTVSGRRSSIGVLALAVAAGNDMER